MTRSIRRRTLRGAVAGLTLTLVLILGFSLSDLSASSRR